MEQVHQNPRNIRRCIRRREVISKTGLSVSSIHNMEKAGKFPKHFLLSPRCAVWDELEVDQWIASRKSASVLPLPMPKSPGRSRRTALGKRRASA